ADRATAQGAHARRARLAGAGAEVAHPLHLLGSGGKRSLRCESTTVARTGGRRREWSLGYDLRSRAPGLKGPPIVGDASRAAFPSQDAGLTLASVRTGALESKDDARNSGGQRR